MKTIYDEAIESLTTPIVHDTIYGVYEGYMLSEEERGVVFKALERAKKEHELLGLYREYYGHIPYSDNPRIKYCEQKIDQLEDKLEELK